MFTLTLACCHSCFTGHKHNFNKYNSSSVTDYGVGYDYKSIMHYSAYAFSKNDRTTITAKVSRTTTPSEKGCLKVCDENRELGDD